MAFGIAESQMLHAVVSLGYRAECIFAWYFTFDKISVSKRFCYPLNFFI